MRAFSGPKAVLAYLLLVSAFFARTWIRGAMLGPGDYWSHAYPLGLYLGERLFDGGLHLWLPYEFLGSSLLGMLQAGVLYPPNYLHRIAPGPVAAGANLVFHCVLAASSTFFYVRRIGGKPFPAFLAGLVFCFSGFLMAHKGQLPLHHAACWLPVLVYLYERIRVELSWKFSLWASFAVAMQIHAGHLQGWMITFPVLCLFTIFHLGAVERGKRRRFALLALVPVVLGLAMSALQLGATAELLERTARGNPTYGVFAAFSLAPRMLLTLAFPYAFGEGTYGGLYTGPWNLTEMVGFVGVFPLVVAVWAAARFWKTDRPVLFWAALAVLALLLALGDHTPLHKVLFHLPWFRNFRAPARHLLEVDLAISILFAFGVQALLDSGASARAAARKLALGIALVALSGLAIPWILRSGQTPPQGVIRAGLIPPLCFSGLYLAWLGWFRSRRPTQAGLAAVLLALVYAEEFSFGAFYSPLRPTTRDGKDRIELLERMRRTAGEDRIVVIDEDTFPLYNLVARLHTLNGYDPLVIQEVQDLLNIEVNGVTADWERLLENNVILSLLNVRYILLPSASPLDLGRFRARRDRESRLRNPVLLGEWRRSHVVERGDGFVLQSPDGAQPSVLKQTIHLEQDTGYLFSIEATAPRGSGARASLFYDVVAPAFDPAELQLKVLPWELGDSPGPFFLMTRTARDVPAAAELRVFTFSTAPIQVRDIVLAELRDAPAPLLAPAHDAPLDERGYWLYEETSAHPPFRVFRNRNCLPRAFAVRRLRAAENLKEVKKLLYLYEVDPSDTALVSSRDLAEIGEAGFGEGRVSVESYETDRVVIRCEFDGRGFAVLSDQYFPGWKATVDGEETKIYRVDGLLRGVAVPGGSHEIVFRYEPRHLWWAALLSAGTLLGCVVALATGVRGRARRG